ncbi:MAG: sulfotransferase [Kiritimatiellae bacterium]|nr:sulfotransferase [Kiritimatiellia bacterium]
MPRNFERQTRRVELAMITVVGRGHSGTRAISHTLSQSGVFMGAKLNKSGDLIPAEEFYEACRVFARHVIYLGGLRWDFSRVLAMPVEPEFRRLVESYLASVLQSRIPRKGWKLPETTLVLPWIIKMFPDNHYIYWVRDPRDSILGPHLTDQLDRFGVPWEKTEDIRLARAISWKYQREIVKATPKPEKWIEVRFEDFVLDQTKTLRRLERFLGFPLTHIPVNPEAVGRWKSDTEKHDFDFLYEDMVELGYLAPEEVRI